MDVDVWVLLSKLSIATQFLLVHLGQTVRNWSVATSNLKNFSRCGLWLRWCCLKADMQHYLLTLSLSLIQQRRWYPCTLYIAHADSTFISLEDYLKTVCRLLLNYSLLAVMLAFPGNSWGFLYKKHRVPYKHLLLSVCMSVCVWRSGTTSIITHQYCCVLLSHVPTGQFRCHNSSDHCLLTTAADSTPSAAAAALTGTKRYTAKHYTLVYCFTVDFICRFWSEQI